MPEIPVPGNGRMMGFTALTLRDDTTVNEEVWILANNHPVARGEIQINDERIAIAVTREANVYDYMAGGT